MLPFGGTGVPSVAAFTRCRSPWGTRFCIASLHRALHWAYMGFFTGRYIALLYRSLHRSLHRTTALPATRCRSPRVVAVSCCCSPKSMPMSQSSVSVAH